MMLKNIGLQWLLVHAQNKFNYGVIEEQRDRDLFTLLICLNKTGRGIERTYLRQPIKVVRSEGERH